MADKDFLDLYFDPLQHQLAPILNDGDPEPLRVLLDALKPDALKRALQSGARNAVRENSWISPTTEGKINRSVERCCALADNLTPLWDQIDNYDRNGTWEALAAGVLSEETQTGIAIGTALLPGIGTAIGGAIGGWLAGNKIDEEADEAMEEMDRQFQIFYHTAIDDYNDSILPSLVQDMEALEASQDLLHTEGGWTERFIVLAAVVGAVVMVGGALYGLYRLIF